MEKNEKKTGKTGMIGISAIILPVFCLVLSAGAQVSQERQIGAFKAIENRGSVDLYLYQGSSQRVIIEADKSAIDEVDTWIDDGTLVIDMPSCPMNVKILKAHVTVTDIEKVVINGSGDLKSETGIQSSALEVKVNGSGDISLQVDAEDFDLRISGSGDASIEGSVNKAFIGVSGSGDVNFHGGTMTECIIKLSGSGDIELSGESGLLQIKHISSGDIDADNLIAKNCIIEKSGSGDTHVTVDGDLSVVCSGSGDVYYSGKTSIKSISVSGSGDVRKIN